MRVLIHTIAEDIHAAAVATVLRRLGVDVTLSLECRAPVDQVYSFRADSDGEARSFRFFGESRELDGGIDLVWWRRRGRFDTSGIHPDDVEFVGQEFRAFLDGFWEGAARDAVWINPREAARRADTKLPQLSAARRVGLPVSPTLVSNDPEEIVAFVAGHGLGNVIFKTIRPAFWKKACGAIKLTNTSLVTEAVLGEPEDLRLCPGIYQVLVKKAAELRVTVMGDRVFCAEIVAGDLAGAEIDWRIGQHEMRVHPFDLPPAIAEKCRRLVADMGLVFGCLDIILGEDGDFRFLEVNEMGQFLWIEELCPEERYLEAFVQFLFRTAGSRIVPEGIAFAEVRISADCHETMRRMSGALGKEAA